VKKLSPAVAVFALALVAGFAIPAAAPACQASHCAIVSTSPFCRRCVLDTGEASAACMDSGNCGCFYFQCAAVVAPPTIPAAADWRTFVVDGRTASAPIATPDVLPAEAFPVGIDLAPAMGPGPR